MEPRWITPLNHEAEAVAVCRLQEMHIEGITALLAAEAAVPFYERFSSCRLPGFRLCPAPSVVPFVGYPSRASEE
jgi:hypothetical protein